METLSSIVLPGGSTQIVPNYTHIPLLAAFSSNHDNLVECDGVGYDQTLVNDLGQSVFLSAMTVEMSRFTKQYERNAVDITNELIQVTDPNNNHSGNGSALPTTPEG